MKDKLLVIGVIFLVAAGFLAAMPGLTGGLNPGGLRWDGLFFFGGFFMVVVWVVLRK